MSPLYTPERKAILDDIYGNFSDLDGFKTEKNATGSGGRAMSLQKRLLVMMIVVGCAGLFFGLWRTNNLLKRPFATLSLDTQKDTLEPENITQNISQNLGMVASADTDGDGLSDADETTIYKTSPYLEDSDSDGVSDGAEVVAGTDPNCLKGSACDHAGVAPVLTDTNVPVDTAAPALSAKPPSTDPAELRNILELNGVDPAYLKNITDTDLMATFQSVINEQQAVPATDQPVSQSKTATADVTSMSPMELRAFLKQNGVADDVIKSFSDDELLGLVKEVQTAK